MYTSTLLFLNIGTPELMLIMLVVLLLFGGSKLPELARGLGKGMREFKDASEGVKREIHRNINAINDDLNVDLDSDTHSNTSKTTEYAVDKSPVEEHTENEHPAN